MPIKLVFRGGLFTVLPGTGSARKVDVHMRLPEQVRVFDSEEKNMTELEVSWSSATRLDFECPGSITPVNLPLRQISHLIPIDYHGFHKIVSFTGGRISGKGGAVSRAEIMRMTAVKKRAKQDEMLSEFKRFARITNHDHDHEYLKGLTQAFFERINAEELRCWMQGYSVEVKFASRGTRVVVNGRRSKAQTLPDGIRVEFPMDPQSTIPHYPLGNPHVLEEPPTI
jgi:hypothetical protein